MNLRVKDHSRSVLTTSVPIVGDNPRRQWILLVNQGVNHCHLMLGNTAVADTGIYLAANGGALLLDKNAPWYASIHAIADTAAVIVTCLECEAY